MSERKPLTLEELRKMDGKPVLFVSLKDGRRKWRVVQSIEKLVEVVKVICFTDDGGETVESYGKTWLAYAAELPSLDRLAWEPCEHCKPPKYAVYPLAFYSEQSLPVVGNKIYRYDTDEGWSGEEINFCPWCGRPLTDAAWEMLERSLAEKV